MLLKKVFLIYLSFNISIVMSSENYENFFVNIHTEINVSTPCIQNIIAEHFTCGGLLTVIYSANDVNDWVPKLIETMTRDVCYSIISRSFQAQDWLTWSDIYIIVAEDMVEFITGMSQLTNDLMWNPRGRFIIQVLNTDDIEEVFTELLTYKIYDVVVISNSSKDEDVIYTYFPFNNGNCGRNFDDIVNLGNCDNIDNVMKSFPNKISNGFNGCTIRVLINEDMPISVFETGIYTVDGIQLVGLEQLLLDTLAIHQNFSLEYQYITSENKEYRNYGVVLMNKTSTGVLGSIQRNETDIGAGGFILIRNHADYFDYIWGYNYGFYNLFLAKLPEDDWKKVYQEFGPQTWMIIGVFCGVIAFMFLVLHGLSSETPKDYLFIILRLWGYFYNNTCQVLAKKKKLRPILTCWIWFTFFVTNFYSTAFFSLITGRTDQTRYINPLKLRHLPHKPCISDVVRTYYKYVYDRSWPENDRIECQFAEQALLTVASRPEYFGIEMRHVYELREYAFLDEEGNSRLDFWDLSSSVNVLYFARGFPVKDDFQRYARRMYETGILKAQLNLIHFKIKTAAHKQRRHFKNVGIRNIAIPIVILCFGNCISFIAFFVEIFGTMCVRRIQKYLS